MSGRNQIRAISAKHIASVEDPYNFGATFSIRRSGHPVAVNLQQVDTMDQINVMRAMEEAKKRLKDSGKTPPTSETELALADKGYAEFLAQRNDAKNPQEDAERQAASYVAGWSGEDVFDESSLPTGGAFTVSDVIGKAFSVFGEYTDEDIPILPRYVESSTLSHELSKDVREKLTQEIESYVEAVEKILQEPKMSDFESNHKLEPSDKDSKPPTVASLFLKSKIEWMSAESGDKREEEILALQGDHHARLETIGVKETLHGGLPVREGIVLFIIDQANELEDQYQRTAGFLSGSSVKSRGLQASSRVRTRTARKKKNRK